MNVYDFDKTIFYPDSTVTFLTYSLLRNGRAFEKNLPNIAISLVRYLKSGDFHDLKEELFWFLSTIGDVEGYVNEFWDKNIDKVGQWYLEKQKSDDLVISASPDFLVRPVAQRLGFHLIATRMDPTSGDIKGLNCKGKEKVRRYRELYGDTPIEEFYSDSLSDSPMAELARHAYLVDHFEISPWPEQEVHYYD